MSEPATKKIRVECHYSIATVEKELAEAKRCDDGGLGDGVLCKRDLMESSDEVDLAEDLGALEVPREV